MTTEPVHPNVARVVDAARRAGLRIVPRHFPEGTRTAEDAARAVGCDVAQIVKSLVFMADDEPILALVSGANLADTARLAAAVGAAGVRRADAGEVRAATGFAIGGVPPFGHVRPLRILIDRDLTLFAIVWAAAGLPDASFPIEPGDLVAVGGGTIAEIAAPAPTAAS